MAVLRKFSCCKDCELKPSEIVIELVTSNNNIKHPKDCLAKGRGLFVFPPLKRVGLPSTPAL